MAGINKVILIGNLGKDPEVRYLENGSTVANVTLATTESYKDRNGNRVDSTEWHDLEMWDGLAKIAEQYLQKGKSIYVEGKIKSDTWQDDQGNNRKRTRIRVLNMTMLGGAQQGGGMSQAPAYSGGQQAAPTPQPASPPAFEQTAPPEDVTDDLPF
ncbi:MAG: single-stranded DNA-binding protein [Cyclobacteriaceae bacterium]|nr:single-stranded DNA-binding protein [Cyclobacteriaceae bacterium HetDA_MAG_MS6]